MLFIVATSEELQKEAEPETFAMPQPILDHFEASGQHGAMLNKVHCVPEATSLP